MSTDKRGFGPIVESLVLWQLRRRGVGAGRAAPPYASICGESLDKNYSSALSGLTAVLCVIMSVVYVLDSRKGEKERERERERKEGMQRYDI